MNAIVRRIHVEDNYGQSVTFKVTHDGTLEIQGGTGSITLPFTVMRAVLPLLTPDNATIPREDEQERRSNFDRRLPETERVRGLPGRPRKPLPPNIEEAIRRDVIDGKESYNVVAKRYGTNATRVGQIVNRPGDTEPPLTVVLPEGEESGEQERDEGSNEQ